MLQKTNLHTMKRGAHEALARDDAAIRALRIVESEAIDAGDLQSASVAPADNLATQPRAVEIDSAQLEAVPHLPDPVEHRAVPLIGGAERSFTGDISCD